MQLCYSLHKLCVLFYVHSVPNDEEGQKDAKHCHDNSRAQAERETEKKNARRRLYVVSVICLIFMVGEIVGKSCGFIFLQFQIVISGMRWPVFPLQVDIWREVLHWWRTQLTSWQTSSASSSACSPSGSPRNPPHKSSATAGTVQVCRTTGCTGTYTDWWNTRYVKTAVPQHFLRRCFGEG